MEARTGRSTQKRAQWRIVALAAVACLAACTGGQRAREVPASGPWCDLLQPGGPVQAVDLHGEGPVAASPGSAVVIAVEGWREPPLRLSEAQRSDLRRFLAAGGRVVLFGYAAALAPQLVEVEAPEAAPFRWGFDARTAVGRARLGLRIVSGRCPELFDGLADTLGEHTPALTGGAPCCVPACSWPTGAPRGGEVLATFAAERDGELSVGRAAALVRFPAGRGELLACGLMPGVQDDDAPVAANARRFLQNCVAWGRGGQRAPAVLCVLPAAVVPEPPVVPARFADRDVPGAPLLAHWGWQAAIAAGEPTVRPPNELVEEVLLPSWRSGADLLDLRFTDAEHGLPLPWRSGDPLRRPDSFRGDSCWQGWHQGAVGGLAAEAHARGMLLSATVDPLPVGPRTSERLVALRFLARELADVRRSPTGALDALAVRQWPLDLAGYGPSMLQDFHPGAALLRVGEAAAGAGGAQGALDADDGALPGFGLSGLSADWRDGFPADRFPHGVLDARAVRPAGDELGGSAFPDWLVQQANDFVRPRRSSGGALWWRADDPRTLGPRTAAYVQGLCLEPLRAAVAMPLSATGSDGYRAAAAALLPAGAPGCGTPLPAPAAVHVLQNNWFRLLGSGGGLLYDPQGLARFRPGEPLVLSPGFLRTRLFGGRPDADSLRSESVDLLAEGERPEGGYSARCDVGGTRREDRLLPAQLAFADAPRWPRLAVVEVHPATGYHELQLQLRPVSGRGVLVVSLDGVVLRCVPFASGEPCAPVVVPVHVARSVARTLELAVGEGGTVALEKLRLVRSGDVGAEARVDVPAGALARLGESSASSYHAEVVDLATLADFPGFLLRVRCNRAVRNLQVERTFGLPGYGDLGACGSGEDARALRAPFVLQSHDALAPDLVVAPLQLPRYDRFTVREGSLSWHQVPEPGLEARVGFWFVPHGTGSVVRAHAAAVFGALDNVAELDLGDRGEATLVNDLPVAWTRIVHLKQRAQTPYSVCENGWWTWRGAQSSGDGGDWLRVHLLPGDAVQVVGGAGLLARTRPGPGSLHVIALRDPAPDAATVRVLQRSRLCAPSVEFAADFDEVFVDDRPWAFHRERTVFLPDRPGTWRVRTVRHGGAEAPHVVASAAVFSRCEYLPAERTLLLVADADPERPVELPYTAVLRGPVPSAVENGELVDDASLRFADSEARAAAAAGGVVIRFRPGVTKVHYGP